MRYSKSSAFFLGLVFFAGHLPAQEPPPPSAAIPPLDRGTLAPGLSCTAEALNVSGFTAEDGSLVVFNVPAGSEDFELHLICRDPLGRVAAGDELLVPVPDGETPVGEIDLEGTAAVPSGLRVSPADLRLVGVGTTLQLLVEAVFPDLPAEDVTLDGTVYARNLPAVAEISAGGLVTARGTGTAILSVTRGGRLGLATVSVLSAPLDALEVSPAEARLSLNPLFGTELVRLTVTGRLDDGSTIDLTTAASGTTFSTSNADVAAVLGDGAVAGISPGVTEVTATNGALSTAAEVTVGVFEPTPTLQVDTPGFAHNAALAGTLVFIADGPGGLQVFDTGGSLPLAGLRFDDGQAEALDVRIRLDLAAVALGNAGIALVDISAPFALREITRIPTAARDVWLSDVRLYAAAGQGLAVWDVNDPAAPQLVGTQTLPSPPWAVAADSSRGVVVALTTAPSLLVLDTNGSPPWPLVSVDLVGAVDDVVIAGNTAYAALGRSGIAAIDLTDPSVPGCVLKAASSSMPPGSPSDRSPRARWWRRPTISSSTRHRFSTVSCVTSGTSTFPAMPTAPASPWASASAL